MEFLKHEINTDLANGDLKSAIVVLYDVLNPSSPLIDKVSTLYFRHSELNNLLRDGLVDRNFAHIEENKISAAMLSLLNDLTKKDVKEKINVRIGIKKGVSESRKQKLWDEILSGANL